VPNQTLKATGPVHLTFKGGATVDSSGLKYAAKTGIWDFGKSTVVIPESMIDAQEETTSP